MDYYIVINGEKHGPFDLLDLIKRVKNGVIQPETHVATSETGEFVPAIQIEELRSLLATEAAAAETQYQGVSNLKIKNIMMDAVELWTRRVIEYTIAIGLIMALGFFISRSLNKIQIVADYSFVADYIVGIISMCLLGLFYYYVLITKRSQEPEMRELKPVLISSSPQLLLYGAIISSGALVFGINDLTKIVTIVGVFFFSSFFAFVPFLIVDHRMTVARAIGVSIRAFKSMSAMNMGIVFMLVGINFLLAILLGMFSPGLILLGLVISLPLTISALAQVYDQVLA